VASYRDTTGHFGSNLGMQITRAADYAVRVMVHLASLPEGNKVPLASLAEATGVRNNFLSKVLQRLVHQGYVTSHRGTGGGFCIEVAAKRATLLQVIECIDGPTQLNVCLGESSTCEQRSWCGVHPIWAKAQEALRGILGGATIEQLAEDAVKGVRQLADIQR
jgi:Rrf2 family protein